MSVNPFLTFISPVCSEEIAHLFFQKRHANGPLDRVQRYANLGASNPQMSVRPSLVSLVPKITPQRRAAERPSGAEVAESIHQDIDLFPCFKLIVRLEY